MAAEVEIGITPDVLGADTVVGTDRPGRRSRGIKQAGWYVLLGSLSLIVLFPIWMTLVRALSTPIAYIEAGQPITPVEPQWDVFSRAWTEGELAQKFAITIVVTLIITAAQVGTSLLAAYAFVFLRFPLRGPLFALFMATLMLPIEVTLLVNAVTIRNLGWLDSFQGLTAPFLLPSGGTRAFGFTLAQPGDVGFGIGSEAKNTGEIDTVLFDAQGRAWSRGAVQWHRLEAGRWILAVRGTPTTPAATVRLGIVGLERPSDDPPSEEVRRFLALAANASGSGDGRGVQGSESRSDPFWEAGSGADDEYEECSDCDERWDESAEEEGEGR